MNKYLVLAMALLASACSTTPHKPIYTYNEILVVNNSREMLRDVTITVPNTGGSFSCGNVAPLGICSNRFTKRRYDYNPIRINWVYGNAAQQTDEFVVSVPSYFSTGIPLKGVLEISESGAMSAYFDQDTPFR